MKKSMQILAGCLISVVFFQAFTVTPEPEFKNLQILPKNISEDALDSVMHHFTSALNVRCNFCHARNDETRKMNFASDERPEKLITRKMMLMAIDINKNHFQQIEEEQGKPSGDTASVNYMLKYVTCYTCHRGDPHPENLPPKKSAENKPWGPPPGQQPPAGKQ